MKPVLIILALLSARLFSTPTFTQAPVVTVNGPSLTISFTASEATDAEVAILDSLGRVVSHLAAGVIGDGVQSPAPLQSGLGQSLVWDGRNDDDEPASGPFTVRVRLGVLPEFDTSFSTRNIFPSNYRFYDGALSQTSTYQDSAGVLLTYGQGYIAPLYFQSQGIMLGASNSASDLLVHQQNLSNATVFKVDSRTGARLATLPQTAEGFPAATASYTGIGEPVYSWDGRYYYYHDAISVYRFDLQGNPAPWPGTGSHVVTGFSFSDASSGGVAAGPDTSVYVIHYAAFDTIFPQCVSKIKDGVVVKPRFITVTGSLAGGIRVDEHGNVYLGARVKPLGKHWPDFVETDSLEGDICVLRTQKNWADEMYGSILKFDSAGGVIAGAASGYTVEAGSGAYPGGPGCAVPRNVDRCSMTGVQWMYFGISHVLNHTTYRVTKCWCHQVRFGLDGWGRSFFPNTFMSEFGAIDNNANEMWRIKYRDLQGVTIGVGHQLEATDEALYLADWFNNQIVRFNWKADAEWTSAPLLASGERLDLSGWLVLEAHPNPFSGGALIRFQGAGKGGLRIYDISGRLVRTFPSSRGGTIRFNGRDDRGRLLAPGVYLCCFRSSGLEKRLKVSLVR